MTAEAEENVNFETMRAMIDELVEHESQDDVNPRTVKYGTIRINQKTKRLHNKQETKTFRLCFNKREIDWENATAYRLPTAAWGLL